MADWFDQNMLPASVRNGYEHAARRAAGDAAKAAEASAWTKMAERRQAFVNAGMPNSKPRPTPDMRHGVIPIWHPAYDGPRLDEIPNSYGMFSLAAPVFRLASNITKPMDYWCDYNAKREQRPRLVPGNPRKRSIFNEWADVLDPPYRPRTIPGIENIKRPDFRYSGPEQIASLLPGHVGQMLAKNKK